MQAFRKNGRHANDEQSLNMEKGNLLESSGKQPLECFYYQDKQSQYDAANWSDLEPNCPTKKEIWSMEKICNESETK